jgi:hypothetical protein
MPLPLAIHFDGERGAKWSAYHWYRHILTSLVSRDRFSLFAGIHPVDREIVCSLNEILASARKMPRLPEHNRNGSESL